MMNNIPIKWGLVHFIGCYFLSLLPYKLNCFKAVKSFIGCNIRTLCLYIQTFIVKNNKNLCLGQIIRLFDQKDLKDVDKFNAQCL